jgi:hypothetical protein
MPLSDTASALDHRAAQTARPAFIVLLTACLYFAQGLPLGFIFGAYPVCADAADLVGVRVPKTPGVGNLAFSKPLHA